MANEEALTLDGLALNDGVTLAMRSLAAPPPRERQDWIGAADSETQLLVRKPLHENRKITARLVVAQQATMDLAHDKIALVIDKLAKASKYPGGIALTWTPATSTRTVTFDVLAGEIVDLPIDWENGWLAKSPELTVEMTAMPYWRGTETLTSSSSSSLPLVTVEVTGVTGDVPALGRLIVTDNASQSRRHVEWGVEGLYYNSGTSLILDSDSLVTSGFAGSQTTRTGAYDPNASGNNAILATAWGTPVAVCGTGNQSHVGVFKVKARIQQGPNTYIRFTWRVGDGPWTSNDWTLVNAASVSSAVWSEVDLGSVTVPPVTVGTQRWDGRVEIYSNVTASIGVDQTAVDYIELVPQLEGYGLARAVATSASGVLVGADSFTSTTAGSGLNGRSAPAGGTWATSGATTDFAFADLYGESLLRSTTSDSGPRFAVLGTATPSDVEVQASVFSAIGTLSGTVDQAVLARWVDSSNYLYATYRQVGGTPVTRTLEIRQVVAGVETLIAAATIPSVGLALKTLRLVVYSSGLANATLVDAGTTVGSASASSSALATAGALATGKSGLLDRSTASLSVSRSYDDLTVSTPAAEPMVIYSGRNMQIRYDDVIRQDSSGTYAGRPQSYRGSRFLVPVGTSRVAVKARRNDVETAADDNIADSITVQIGWTPRGLAVPR